MRYTLLYIALIWHVLYVWHVLLRFWLYMRMDENVLQSEKAGGGVTDRLSTYTEKQTEREFRDRQIV